MGKTMFRKLVPVAKQIGQVRQMSLMATAVPAFVVGCTSFLVGAQHHKINQEIRKLQSDVRQRQFDIERQTARNHLALVELNKLTSTDEVYKEWINRAFT